MLISSFRLHPLADLTRLWEALHGGKVIQQLADEFERTVKKIITDKREHLLEGALTLLLADPSFNDLSDRSASGLLGSESRQLFLRWSTGHKIVLHAIANLVAYTERRSLILFDEPKTHLHPPLLAALMHAVRFVLGKLDAFCVIATHSPVVLQETMARHVHVVRREGDKISVNKPTTQTFGENIGIITSEVFGLTSDVTDYHQNLSNISEHLSNLDEVEALFDGELSMQARAYLMGLFATKKG